jgi:protease-4
VITLSGPIDAGSGNALFEPEGLASVIDQIHAHRDDDQVKALVIRINSPGGTVGASQEIYQELKRFKAKTHKPVIVSVADLGASGAYWVAMAGDVIVANPGSLVGSIGVIMSGMDFEKVPARYGIGMRTMKSGKYKDMLSSWRPVTEEERGLMQTMLDDVHAQFIDVLIAERKIPTDDAIQLAQGQVFSGRQAQKLKLVDQLGGMTDALEIARKKAKLGHDYEVIHKAEPSVQNFLQHYLGAQVKSLLPDLSAVSTPRIR